MKGRESTSGAQDEPFCAAETLSVRLSGRGARWWLAACQAMGHRFNLVNNGVAAKTLTNVTWPSGVFCDRPAAGGRWVSR